MKWYKSASWTPNLNFEVMCNRRKRYRSWPISSHKQSPVISHRPQKDASDRSARVRKMDVSTATWRLFGRALQPILKVASIASTPFKAHRESTKLATSTLRSPLFQYLCLSAPAEVLDTPYTQVEAAIEELTRTRTEWRSVSCSIRAQMLEDCLTGLTPIAIEASEAATDAHGSYGTGIGEELVYWVPIALALLEYKHAMESEGAPEIVRLTRRSDQWIADVFPQGIFGSLFGDLRVEVWIQPGQPPTQGRIYREKQGPVEEASGAISLVLGAGNHINVVILDVLHKLICDDDVVLVKMNPQNAFLGVFVERALTPFFQRNFVKLIYGDVQMGDYLTHHSSIDNIHLTGSVQTFNSIVFGSPVVVDKVSFSRFGGELVVGSQAQTGEEGIG